MAAGAAGSELAQSKLGRSEICSGALFHSLDHWFESVEADALPPVPKYPVMYCHGNTETQLPAERLCA